MAAEDKPTRKSTQSTGRRTATKKATSGAKGSGDRSGAKAPSDRSTPRTTRTNDRRPADIVREAAVQLAELIGQAPEAVTAYNKTEEGWRLEFEVLEIHRVPETADVMALYQADLDSDEHLVSYRRTTRYTRGQVREE